MDLGSILSGNPPTPYPLPPTPQGERDGDRSKDDLKKAAQEFESYFISYMLKEMRKTVPADSLFGGGRGEEIYRSFQDEALAKSMVESGGIGLSDIIIRELSKGLASPPPQAKPLEPPPQTLAMLAQKTLKSNRYPADKGIAENISTT
ncbi:MAG: rod-binding protein [Nitrospirae bacterium]|nr:rod-binding protein [Nitrospirota bacterium]